jgi:hypothetical protein
LRVLTVGTKGLRDLFKFHFHSVCRSYDLGQGYQEGCEEDREEGDEEGFEEEVIFVGSR